MAHRERELKENVKTKTIKVYPSEWDELKVLLDEEGKSLSSFVRSSVYKELKKRRSKKCNM